MSQITILFKTIWTSIVRTFVPQVAGLLVAFLARWKLELDDDVVTLAVAEGFAFIYYFAVRALEEFKDSKYGKLLGKAVRPTYRLDDHV